MTESVTIDGPDGPIPAAFADPPARSARTPAPGMIVIHEVLGLNADIRSYTQRFADLGYVTVAPDLFGPGSKPVCIARAVRALARNDTTAVGRLETVRGWLAARDGVDAARIGVIGFCMGGGFALLLALRAPLGAVSVNYGPVPPDEDFAGLCPIVGSYGAEDARFAGDGRRLASTLERFGIPHDVKIYDNAGHSFLNDAIPWPFAGAARRLAHTGYHPVAAADAWERITTFFAAHLFT